MFAKYMLINSNDIKIISHFGAIILQTEITKRQLILIRFYFITPRRGSYLTKFNNTIPWKDRRNSSIDHEISHFNSLKINKLFLKHKKSCSQ